ncbi:hypothetical protein SVAN01_05527 [Stagonosporopsis vannaccii]|nr:hypothetical protein SVAN01_05527 [Stagonosporopsis vannaccii]
MSRTGQSNDISRLGLPPPPTSIESSHRSQPVAYQPDGSSVRQRHAGAGSDGRLELVLTTALPFHLHARLEALRRVLAEDRRHDMDKSHV